VVKGAVHTCVSEVGTRLLTVVPQGPGTAAVQPQQPQVAAPDSLLLLQACYSSHEPMHGRSPHV
jgi:hypothetical protein